MTVLVTASADQFIAARIDVNGPLPAGVPYQPLPPPPVVVPPPAVTPVVAPPPPVVGALLRVVLPLSLPAVLPTLLRSVSLCAGVQIRPGRLVFASDSGRLVPLKPFRAAPAGCVLSQFPDWTKKRATQVL